VVCTAYGVYRKDLMVKRRRTANEPRNVAIYLVRQHTGETLERIGWEFNLNKHSSVGSVIERMRKQICKDKRLRKRVAELEKKLIMNLEQN